MVHGLFFAALMVVSHTSAFAQTDLAQKIRSAIDAERIKDKVPAISYAVFNSSGLIAADSLGTANSASLFRIASVSKIFASLSIAQLIEKGQLTLDTSLLDLDEAAFVRFLKKNETPERLQRWGKIQIRHLLAHQAGISKDVPGTLVFFNSESLADNSYPTDQEFYRGLTSVEFLYEPGPVTTGFKYSNLGMNLLGKIAAAYNGENLTFPAYVKKHILQPMQMSSTFYDISTGDEGRMIDGFGALLADGTRTSVPHALYVGSYAGSIGIATIATDLSKLGIEFLQLLKGRPGLLQKVDSIREMFTLKAPAAANQGWANGPLWMNLPGEILSAPVWAGHTGTGTSERAAFLVSPEKNLGVAILFNTIDVNREKYVKIVSDLIMIEVITLSPLETELVASVRSFFQATPAFPPVTPAPHLPVSDLNKYAGSYFADVVGIQEMTLSADGYLMFYGQKLIVEDIARGKFRFPPVAGAAGALFNSEPIRFDLDANGNPTGMRMANVKKFKKM